MHSPPPSPWRTLTNEGERFMVRENAGATWVCRLRDRAVFLFDVGDTPPEWTRAAAQSDLFAAVSA